MNKYKSLKGWFKEPWRHAQAARGVKTKGYRVLAKTRFGDYVSNRAWPSKNKAQSVVDLQYKADKELSNKGLFKKNSLFREEFRTNNKYRVIPNKYQSRKPATAVIVDFVQKGDVVIPITVEPTYESHRYPITPREARQSLEKLPVEQLKGLKEISFRSPSRLPFTEQTRAIAQYADKANRINIYSEPFTVTKHDGLRYKRMLVYLDQDKELRPYVEHYVIPHEVAHHHVLDHLKRREGSQAHQEALANHFMKKE